jgi:hypothetical protein
MAKVALLIGVSEYEIGLNPLPAALKDVEAMQRVLSDLEIGGFDEVKTLINPDPLAMQEAIENVFYPRRRNDLTLLYFSGHGIKDEGGKLYFATRITRRTIQGQLLRATAVSAGFIHEVMSDSRCKRQVVILECCYSGAFAQGLLAKNDGLVDLRNQLGGEGRVMLTASTSTQYSFEQQGADLSIYTSYIVEGLSTGAADLDNDGLITVDELHEYTKHKVQEAAPAMKPEIYTVKEGYKICIAKAPINEPKLRYRKEVERYVTHGEISIVGRRILDNLRKNLRLLLKDAEVIEAEVLKPYQEYKQKLQQYEQAFVDVIGHEYPISAHTRDELKDYQRILGFRDEDIAPIEARIIAEREKKSLQEEIELEKIRHDLVKQKAQIDIERANLQEQLELERIKFKTDFYSSLLQSGNWQMLALQLAQHNEDIAVVVQSLNQQEQSQKEQQIEMLKMLLNEDALEESQLNEVGKRQLQELTRQLEQSLTVWENRKQEYDNVAYYTAISILSEIVPVPVGGELEIIVRLSLDSSDEENAHLLEIPRNEAAASDLNIIITASRFQFDGDNIASLPLDPSAVQATQTAHFRLTALRSGSATITAELYRGDTFETTLETRVQVTGFEEASFTGTRITTQPRPVAQPDFILRVQTAWNDDTNSACRFQYQLRSFRLPSLFPGETNYCSDSLSSSWIEQMRGLLGTTLENISDALPEDGRSRLTSLGQYLFQHLLPPELQTDFRSLIPRDRTFTLLILADQDASLPWELLHDGQRFLSDRFIIGRWFWELNDTRPHEFPVGAINVAHYADVEQPELWTALLEPPGSPPPLPLPEGVLSNLDSTEAMRGLHLIRYSQSSNAANRRNAPVTLDDTNNAQDIERQMRPAKLNVRRNRPLVSLGYVRRDRPELTTLEQTWASAFIRAGCSAFTGSLWAVDPAVEAAFISSFYNRLWTGDSLGEAFHASRQLARAVAPDSLDWLAYVLFGDPMARPYRPVEGKGYAVVEPIGREIDDPLPPGAPVRFRLSLRRTPPVWHEERVIEVAENLAFENLQAHVKTFGLQVTPDSPIAMSLAPTGNYLGWFTLVAPPEMVGNSALVQVFLMDGMQPIHSLMFSLNIENEERS